MQVNLFEDQIKASMEYSKISKMADLLMANLHVCEPGALSITVSIVLSEVYIYYFFIDHTSLDRFLLVSISGNLFNS